MKKIKISQLPLYSSLKGLFTIGTDSNNRSVKVSLEFVEDETKKAVSGAEEATQAAQSATTAAQTATTAANTATTNANNAASAANAATGKAQAATTAANSAAGAANTAAGAANTAAGAANTAAAGATTAKNDANAAAQAAQTATEEAEKATQAAQSATEATIAALAKLIPTGLTVSAIERITLGNVAFNRIEATLTPDGTMPNIIFISDNKAVRIDQKGKISVVGIGASEVQIIPTCNVALAKTIIIRVEAPTLRLGNIRKQLRLTESGVVMLN